LHRGYMHQTVAPIACKPLFLNKEDVLTVYNLIKEIKYDAG
uniref:DegT/DnrJ/EryC1/StrS aminotransferase family protein n=1 Tax=Gongylonema pulchrum TaxID=637853 RepID=A0A183DJU3_9BILA